MNQMLQQVSCKYGFNIIFFSSFANVVAGVDARMKEMRISAIVRFWKHVVLAHYKYICLEKV